MISMARPAKLLALPRYHVGAGCAGDDGKWEEAVGIVGTGVTATARDDAQREEEAKQLEANAEKQRKRAEAWQKLQVPGGCCKVAAERAVCCEATLVL